MQEDITNAPSSQQLSPGWPALPELAKPSRLPEPTYWPFFMAMGLAFGAWGILSTWLVATGGLIVFTISLIGWINTLRHEH